MTTEAKNISFVKDRCTGCGACRNICPHGAIVMRQNDEGFLYPAIDESKCTCCGLCVKSCPLSQVAFKLDTQIPKCFAAQSSDEIMKHSSSGGIFSVLAEYILKKGGYVCGAAFDKNWTVQHKIISNKSGLYDLQTSKYVQSDTNSVFTEIKKLLDQKKVVLFTGTPCQVAGLYAFLKKDYDNLVTVDIFCHGAPSPGVFQRYLKELNIKKIQEINFRDKNTPQGWKEFAFFLKSDTKNIHEPVNKNIYTAGFLKNLYLRKSCHICPFAKVPRQGDFSLGDFWGYKKKNSNVCKGVSAVLLNTPKAQAYFKRIKAVLSFVESVKLDSMFKGNPILRAPVAPNKNRTAFFKDFQTSTPLADTIEKYIGKKNVAIFNFASFTTANFGACLVGYAMEQAVAKLGYIPSTINFVPEGWTFLTTQKSSFEHFRQNFLNLTGLCSNKRELKLNLNNAFDKFIIGSDQIVRHTAYDFAYYMDWVSGDKTLLSYAASFGISKLEMSRGEVKHAKECLDRFDAFSVRELSGADIMKEHFKKDNVPVVCDPTLLLDAQDYQPIIDAEHLTAPAGEYVAYYFLDENPTVLDKLGEKYTLVNAYKDEVGQFRSFGQWLNIIKNAKYVVTDSFHGSVFSIIFKKQFVTLTTKTRGNERLDSLMKILGENRLVTNHDNLTEQVFNKKIDYAKVAKNLSAAQKKGYDYLENALKIKPNKKRNLFKVKKNRQTFSLFGILPVFQIVSKKMGKTTISFLGIPILKTRFGKIYLFGIIKIADVQ